MRRTTAARRRSLSVISCRLPVLPRKRKRSVEPSALTCRSAAWSGRSSCWPWRTRRCRRGSASSRAAARPWPAPCAAPGRGPRRSASTAARMRGSAWPKASMRLELGRRRGRRASAGGSGTACGPCASRPVACRWPSRNGRDPDVPPGRRDRERADPAQRVRVAQGLAVGGAVGEALAGAAARDAGHAVRDVAQPRLLERLRGRIRPARRRVPVLVRHGRRHHSCALPRQNAAPRGAVPPAAEPGAAAPGSCPGAGDGGLSCRPRS